MFDIIYHKTVIVFKTPEEDAQDLIDLVGDTKDAPTKEELISRLNKLFEERKNK